MTNDLENNYSLPMVPNKFKSSPFLEALWVSGLYLILGIIWILISDKLVIFLFEDQEVRETMQLYKGWFYVFSTSIIFLFIIKRRVVMIKKAADNVIGSYEKLEKNRIQLQHLAYHDTLTGLFNRTYFIMQVNKHMNIASKNNQKIAVIVIDIDRFKHVNDMCGNIAGDKLLVDMATILEENKGQGRLLSRLGGNEYALILENFTNTESINIYSKHLNDIVSRIWEYEGVSFHITVSIGVSLFPEHGSDCDTVLKKANTTLAFTKEFGKNSFNIYDDKMLERIRTQILFTSKINNALENNKFCLFYQPVIDLKTGEMVGVEALIRLLDIDGKFISPKKFIPFAEKTRLIHKINDWVIDTAFEQKKNWDATHDSNLKIMINLSGKSLSRLELADEIKVKLNKYKVNPSEIAFEVTETTAIYNYEDTISLLTKLRELGVIISLDDFGIGYSSLTYLQKLPIDILKIDRAFIININDRQNKDYIYQSVVTLAHHLGLKVVAEGVETKDQLQYIKTTGCDMAQGYYFERPRPLEEIDVIIKSNSKYKV